MMRLIILFFFSFIFSQCTSDAQFQSPHMQIKEAREKISEREKLKGNPKSMREISYNPIKEFIDGDTVVTKKKLKEYWYKEFDKNGKNTLSEQTVNYSKKINKSRTHYEYTSDSDIYYMKSYFDTTLMMVAKMGEFGILEESSANKKSRKTYEYDANGNNTNITEYLEGNIQSMTKTNYNNDGEVLEEVKIDSLNNIISKTEYIYNLSGNIKKAIMYFNHENKEETSIFEYEYSSNSKTTYSKHNGKLTGKTIQKVDSLGRIYETIVYKPNDSLWMTTNYKFDDNDNPLYKIVLNHKKGTKVEVFKKYNKHNQKIEEKRVKDGVIKEHRKIEYLYDKHNNWIKKTTQNLHLTKSTPRVTEQIIEYYE